MNRRDFLSRRFLHMAGEILGALDVSPACADNPNRQESVLLRLTHQAMATSFELLLPFGTPDALEVGKAAFDEIDRQEERLSSYRDTSEVSRLNRLAGGESASVEETLFDLLTLAGRLTEETKGAFDVATGSLIRAWGFHNRRPRLPSEQELQLALSRAGMKHVVLDPRDRSVRFLRPEVEINLGGIGKGYALDRVAAILKKDRKVSSALLHGGRSSVYAIGTEPGTNRGWAVGVRHPWDEKRRLAVVRLCDRALATSAASYQHLEHAGRRLGHILDPRTGWPAEGLASATVLAPTAAEADALATAFFVMGADQARLYCETHPEIGALLLPAHPAAVAVTVGNIPATVEMTR